MTFKKTFVSLITVAILAFSVAGCGDDGGGTPDAAGAVDAGTPDAAATPDAPPAGGSALGIACTMGGNECGAGFECLNLQGATGPWCSKRCTPGPTDDCGMGYAGPGVANCFLQIDENGDQTPDFAACGVICQDNPGAPDICTADVCNGTCPGALACTGELTGQDGTAVALGCQ